MYKLSNAAEFCLTLRKSMYVPCDVWETILELVDFSGKYLFLAPVCKQWLHFENAKKTSRNTNFKNILASASTVRESLEHPGGDKMLLRTLSRKNTWSYLAENVHQDVGNLANEIIRIVEWDEFSVGTAGKHGNLGFVAWLRTTELEWDPFLALSCAAFEENLTFLKHMYYSWGYVPNFRTSVGAALVGSVKVLQWLKHIRCDLDDVTQVLAEEGHLNSLIWANSNGFQCNERTLEAAKYGGHIDVLNYLDTLKRRRNR